MSNPLRRFRRSATARRRATTLVATMIALSLVNLAVIGAISASGEDASIGAMRVSTVRAFYAAGSGVRIAVRELMIDETTPVTGVFTLPGGDTVEIVDPFDAPPGLPGACAVEGRSGQARRRLEVEVE